MGKSTLINALLPEARAATREISQALDSGKHTTTHATLYTLNANSSLIDSPGLQEFGLGHIDRAGIEHAFREFRPYLGECRFRDCRHHREPDCAIRQALDSGLIDPASSDARYTMRSPFQPASAPPCRPRSEHRSLLKQRMW